MMGFGRSLGAAAPAIALAALAIAGCGSSGHVGGHLDQRGQTTPADAVSVSASISGTGVTVSPRRIGAGQTIFNIVNSDGRAKTLIARPAGGHGTALRVGSVAAGGSFQIKLDLRPGRYLIGSADSGESTLVSGRRSLRPATLAVGPYRTGGDNDVEQP